MYIIAYNNCIQYIIVYNLTIIISLIASNWIFQKLLLEMEFCAFSLHFPKATLNLRYYAFSYKQHYKCLKNINWMHNILNLTQAFIKCELNVQCPNLNNFRKMRTKTHIKLHFQFFPHLIRTHTFIIKYYFYATLFVVKWCSHEPVVYISLLKNENIVWHLLKSNAGIQPYYVPHLMTWQSVILSLP